MTGSRATAAPRAAALLALLALLAGCDSGTSGGQGAGPAAAPDRGPGPAPAARDEGLEPVRIAGETFRLELATDESARQQGLMYRDHIADHGGMLFIFPDAQVRNFWMAYCLVDIDLIYLDPRGRVTAVHRMKAQAPRGEGETVAAYEARMRKGDYSSRFGAQFAIELPAGTLDRLHVKVEDPLELDLDRLKAMAR